jgi:hypothetical protein
VFWGFKTDDSYESARHTSPLFGHNRNRLCRFETRVFERYLDGSICQHQIASAPEAVEKWLQALCSRAKGGRVTIGIEMSRGPLFHSLSQHPDWIDIFPVNPQTLARYRQAFYPSRAKDDPVDSQLLEELIRSHPDRLRIYRPGPEMERKLDLLCQQRRKVIGMAVELENQLRATLKEYFPLAIDLCASNGLRNKLALDFLQRWPTYALLKKARSQTLRSFYYAHNARNQALIEARLAKFSSSVPLTEDTAVIEPLSIVAQMLVCAIRAIERMWSNSRTKLLHYSCSTPIIFHLRIFRAPARIWLRDYYASLVRIDPAGPTPLRFKSTAESLP